MLPALTGLAGPLYAVVSIAGGALFVLLALRLLVSRAGDAAEPVGPDGLYVVKAGSREARDLFAVSILYLFALFAALLVEHGLSGSLASRL